ITIDFFPEGGNLVQGHLNTIAFKANHENGLPVSVTGVIKNRKGEEVVSFKDFHDGMGMFVLDPLPGEKYSAVLREPVIEEFSLPDPVERGIVLSVIPHPQGFFFEIQQQTTDLDFTAAYILGQMQHHIVFRQQLNNSIESVLGIINTGHLRSGILQVTVFNRNGMPLAERLCFVNNLEYVQPAELIIDTLDFSARGRNRFRIAMRDTVQGSVSVSIVDAAYDGLSEREDNILTSFLLTSDIKGYVHRPTYYFSAMTDSVKTAADLLMMTNGWRRFKWSEVEKRAANRFNEPAYITLAGRATLKGTNRSFADKNLLLMINSTGTKKRRSTYMLATDKEGNFFIDSLVFYDKNRLLFSDTRGKKSQYIDIALKGDSLSQQFAWSRFKVMPDRTIINSFASRWQMDYNAIMKENGLMLEGITVKTRWKNPAEQIDDRYTTGLFSGDASKSIDLVNNDEAMSYNNIFDYLQSRVNGLQIINDGAEYGIFYRQTTTASSMGNIPMTLFLDELETDASVIASVPANQVALVKVFTTFSGAWGSGGGGALAIYTKKDNDITNSTGKVNMSVYNGYSVIKEFYAPDHKLSKASEKPDNRVTLDWRPSIFVNNIDPKIPVSFFNNDRTKQFRVIVEGMTTSGKFIFLEKLITGK
ncbi:MAG TPA: hypothetical protein VMZ03_11840, partial [Chitinophagaceae bacterium]|nr:hypothetical protein [Chitinophagaceae bacterium]